MPDRAKVKIGDTVKAVWFDDPTWYEGQVKEDEDGLFIDVEGDIIGYLNDADEVRLLSRDCDFGERPPESLRGCLSP